jgi:16S rRNA (cytidine1402-2'-O)-methyltransferase
VVDFVRSNSAHENDKNESGRNGARVFVRGGDAYRQSRRHHPARPAHLKEADAIACEDTRQTLKLLSHFDIQKRLISYHEHNELTRAPEIVIELEQGAKIALVSDAGTPAISDPGHRLVSLCVRHGIKVVPLPGPSAFVAALAASGMPVEEFAFVGFLPARQSARRKALRALASEPRTLALYEAPHRLSDTLDDALEILGNRPAGGGA